MSTSLLCLGRLSSSFRKDGEKKQPISDIEVAYLTYYVFFTKARDCSGDQVQKPYGDDIFVGTDGDFTNSGITVSQSLEEHS